MYTIASQITSLTIVYSIVYSDADQRKHQSSASLALCAENSPWTGEFPAQMASYAENVSIWWRHHEKAFPCDDIIIIKILTTGWRKTSLTDTMTLEMPTDVPTIVLVQAKLNKYWIYYQLQQWP